MIIVYLAQKKKKYDNYHDHITVTYKKNNIPKTEQLYIRAGFNDLFSFINQNIQYFNVGFWSNSYKERTVSILKALFKNYPLLLKNVLMVFGNKYKIKRVPYTLEMITNYEYDKTHYNTGSFKKDYVYDILKKKTYKEFNKMTPFISNIISKYNYVKDIDILCKLPYYKKLICKERTLLIDCDPNNILANKNNSIRLNIYHPNFVCDNTLIKLQKWLMLNMKLKTFKNVELPDYYENNPLTQFNENHLNNADLYEIPKVCAEIYKEEDKQNQKDTNDTYGDELLNNDKSIVNEYATELKQFLKAKKSNKLQAKVDTILKKYKSKKNVHSQSKSRKQTHKQITQKLKKRLSSSKTKKTK